ncbi:myosin light chain kinase [Dictyostelium discoideum AX4]|uniref:Myosin light chain kinase A n=1 Tax=Dictyostelium discoideum TaxID=44689 RepID=MYLKA_DICDI|nr:myosin light chain kinase [Dictyostelium discoideum AX4]P25323.2 RecName: Full=Myosin light chain kinase A; Short=MLCK-A [Dictyostelium discoideum]AAB06337.1 myosin light chain kinase [Dictyostelium discoideum]EAL67434.1 myosin light chain kinase [Dictyostelium discoideum AX4]|eukprot:XP_641424.1 myosin light chain kinase [Dictyostelium discoideum AX4]
MTEVEKIYEFKEELGRGAFSIVYLGENKQTKQRYAIKVINKSELGKDYEKNLKMEVDILKKVNHPNIIALKELFDTPEKLYLVMELVTGGELFDKIVEKGSYSEADAANLVKKIVSAVGYLHGLNIVHRDLKPENLLLKSKENHLEVAIADFGLSKIIGQTLVMQTACGTPSYVAPEVLNATGYDKEVDMWSIGVITYILLCGFPPFYGDTVPEIFEQIMEANYEFPEEYWGGISKEAKDFIGKLLVVDVSKRLNATNALNHPWLKSNNSNNTIDTVKMKEYIVERQKTQTKLVN